MIKLTITWASPEDRLANKEFSTERSEKFEEFVREDKIDRKLSINTPKDSPVGIVVTKDTDSAKEWEVFILNLAAKYNKKILYVTKEEI